MLEPFFLRSIHSRPTPSLLHMLYLSLPSAFSFSIFSLRLFSHRACFTSIGSRYSGSTGRSHHGTLSTCFLLWLFWLWQRNYFEVIRSTINSIYAYTP